MNREAGGVMVALLGVALLIMAVRGSLHNVLKAIVTPDGGSGASSSGTSASGQTAAQQAAVGGQVAGQTNPASQAASSIGFLPVLNPPSQPPAGQHSIPPAGYPGSGFVP